MPVRTAEIRIENRTQFSEHPERQEAFLRLTRAENCWGTWSQRHAPPETIAPGETTVIRAESDDVMSGVSGYFEYEFVKLSKSLSVTPQAGACRMYVLFDNPYFAGAHGRRTGLAAGLTNGTDIDLNCLAGTPFKSLADFGQQRIRNAQTAWDYEIEHIPDSQNAGEAEWGDLNAAMAGAAGNALHIVSTRCIVAQSVFHLRLNSRRQSAKSRRPELVSFVSHTLRPMHGIPTDFWVDDWKAIGPHGTMVRAHIERSAHGELQASVEDNTLGDNFSLSARHLRVTPRIADECTADIWAPISLNSASKQEGTPPHTKRNSLRRRRIVDMPLVDTLVVDGTCYLQAYCESDPDGDVTQRLRYVRYSALHMPVCDVMLSNRLL